MRARPLPHADRVARPRASTLAGRRPMPRYMCRAAGHRCPRDTSAPNRSSVSSPAPLLAARWRSPTVTPRAPTRSPQRSTTRCRCPTPGAACSSAPAPPAACSLWCCRPCSRKRGRRAAQAARPPAGAHACPPRAAPARIAQLDGGSPLSQGGRAAPSLARPPGLPRSQPALPRPTRTQRRQRAQAAHRPPPGARVGPLPRLGRRAPRAAAARAGRLGAGAVHAARVQRHGR